MTKKLRLPHGEADFDEVYFMPDPDALRVSFAAVLRHQLYGERSTPEQFADVIRLAEGYMVLTTGAAGQECCVNKLRDIWRARRAREKARNE